MIIGKKEITVTIPKVVKEGVLAVVLEGPSQIVWMRQVDFQLACVGHHASCPKPHSFKTIIF